MRQLFRFAPGPGILVTAAFIGPGTVTVCLQAGMKFQFSLMWAMVFSVIATIILQEMAARLGLVTQRGLGATVVKAMPNSFLRTFSRIIMGVGILLGNAAFEAGNLTGTSIGLQMMTGMKAEQNPFLIWSSVALAAWLLWSGNHRKITGILTLLVLAMSLAFLYAAMIAMPSLELLLRGIFIPAIPVDSLLIIVGLIGTTVVPYNLFMHAALVKDQWKSTKDILKMQTDSFWSIFLGGIISMAIIITGASAGIGNAEMGLSLGKTLEPVFGASGTYIFGFGIFAAGFTSTITAPMAAALVARELMNLPDDSKDFRYRAVWMLVLLTGGIFSSLGLKPIEMISLAQFANGLLLPFIAFFLLWTVNQKTVMGEYRNRLLQNVTGSIVFGITVVLGTMAALKALQHFI